MIPFAVELYRSGNKSYQALARASLGSLLFAVEKGLAHNLSQDPEDWKKIQGYNASTMADFLDKVYGYYRKEHCKVTLEEFWLGLKLLEIPYPVGPRKRWHCCWKRRTKKRQHPKRNRPNRRPWKRKQERRNRKPKRTKG